MPKYKIVNFDHKRIAFDIEPQLSSDLSKQFQHMLDTELVGVAFESTEEIYATLQRFLNRLSQ
jgi:hypothetical protein